VNQTKMSLSKKAYLEVKKCVNPQSGCCICKVLGSINKKVFL
jgi:hypothetical protein